MRRVDVQLPYERQMDPKNPSKEILVLPGLQWPQKCACCLQTEELGRCALEREVPMPGEKVALLRWQVPYCGPCRVHAKNAARLLAPTILAGLGLYLAFGYLLFINGLVEDNVLGYSIAFGLLAVVCVVAYLLYRLAGNLFVKPKMTGRCSHHAYAAAVPQHTLMEEKQIQLVFVFNNDAYGEEFAAMNAAYRVA